MQLVYQADFRIDLSPLVVLRNGYHVIVPD
jgi:hypothetical protein